MILLKTDISNLDGVLKHAKHATDDPPNYLLPGDLLLIQRDQTSTGSICGMAQEELFGYFLSRKESSYNSLEVTAKNIKDDVELYNTNINHSHAKPRSHNRA